MDHPREIRISNVPKNAPTEEIQKAVSLLDVLEQKDIAITDAIGHSEGGLYLALAAFMHPEKFRNLIFVDPAGMIGKDSFLNLAYRFMIKEGKQSKLPSIMMMKSMSEFIASNPSMALKEIKQLSEADIYQMIKSLKEKGINISFVFGNDDKVFPMEKVQETYTQRKENGEIKDFKDILNGFYSVKGTHGEFIGHGELLPPKSLPKGINHILDTMENLPNKN